MVAVDSFVLSPTWLARQVNSGMCAMPLLPAFTFQTIRESLCPGDRGVGIARTLFDGRSCPSVVRAVPLYMHWPTTLSGRNTKVWLVVVVCLARERDEDCSVHGDEWLLGLLQRLLHALCIGSQGLLTQDEASNAGLCVLHDFDDE